MKIKHPVSRLAKLGSVVLMMLPLAIAQPANGDDFTPSGLQPERFIEYERQLNAILKTRRDEEKVFIAQVVNQVRAGKLPAKLVNTSFDWVRKKRPDTAYPFIYFERVLRLQAERLKIAEQVPPFDFEKYRRSVGQLESAQRGVAGQSTNLRELQRITPGTRR